MAALLIFKKHFSIDYAELVDSVPILGELLLDDFRVTKPENYEHLNENIEVVHLLGLPLHKALLIDCLEFFCHCYHDFVLGFMMIQLF